MFPLLFIVIVELPKQVTVAIIKPDAVQAGLVDEIIQKVIIITLYLFRIVTYHIAKTSTEAP